MNNGESDLKHQKTYQKIGVLDAGIGGLYALSKIKQRVPGAEITYIGDCRNLPHSAHSNEWITGKTQQMVDFLQKQDIDTLAIACHTISSLEASLKTEGLSVFNIITPTLQDIKEREELQHYLFIGTRTTIESGRYQPSWIKKEYSSYLKAVEMTTRIENDGANHPNTIAYIENLLSQHFQNSPSISVPITIVLACTHYFLIKSHIKNWMKTQAIGASFNVIEPSMLLANKFPISNSSEKGAINLYFNQNKEPSFQKKLDGILDTLGLGDASVHFIHL